MNGAILLPFALLAAIMAVPICREIWLDRLLAPFQWLTRASYPRGFPIILGLQIIAFFGCILLGILLALSGS